MQEYENKTEVESFRDASSGQPVHSFGKCLLVALWTCVRVVLFRPTPRRMFFWRNWLLKLFGAELAERVYIDPSVRIEYPWNLKVGYRSSMGREVWVYNLAKITIGEYVTISPRVTLCAGTHDYQQRSFPLVTLPIDIGKGAWLATESFISPGIKIGANAVIGACSVVVKDMPANMVCVGNPCQPVKIRRVDNS